MLPADDVVPPERSDVDLTPDPDIPPCDTVALPLDGDTPLATEEKLLKDMCTKGHERLVVLLQPSCPLGNDYRLLAAKMGYTNEDIKLLESSHEPVKELMIKYDTGRRTIAELVSLLQQIDRPDVVQDLQPYIGRATFFF